MRLGRLTPPTRELLLAIAMTAGVELELALSDHDWTAARGAAALLITLPLAFRLRFPLSALSMVLAGLVAEASLGGHRSNIPVLPVIAMLLALHAVGSRTHGLALVVAAGATLGALVLASLLAGADPGAAVAVALGVTAGGLVA